MGCFGSFYLKEYQTARIPIDRQLTKKFPIKGCVLCEKWIQEILGDIKEGLNIHRGRINNLLYLDDTIIGL